MKLLTAQEIKEWDAFTIKHEPIKSVDLMERAALQCVEKITSLSDPNHVTHIFCGPGNNGGDGLAIARLLHDRAFPVSVFLVNGNQKNSPDYTENLSRLKKIKGIRIVQLESSEDFPVLHKHQQVVDALFGYGLNKPLEGVFAALVEHINASGAPVISIDMPSGLQANMFDPGQAEGLAIIKATYTLTFQVPKYSFLFAETGKFCGRLQLLDIGLHKDFEPTGRVYQTYLDWAEIKPRLKPVYTFNHKGNNGHVMLVGGSYGKMGAAVLMTQAAIHTGCGLATGYVPKVGYTIMQTAVPEAMVATDDELYEIRSFPDGTNFQAIGVGPGLGMHEYTIKGFEKWIKTVAVPVVLDADALNICSHLLQDHHFSFRFPSSCILTPHPKEFDRLAGISKNSMERLEKAIGFALKYQVYIVLKGAFSRIITPEGKVYFNGTGNPGMATGGSGDVLTGIIASLLAQGYSCEDAAVVGVYTHGRAGDQAMEGKSAIAAGEIVLQIAKALVN